MVELSLIKAYFCGDFGISVCPGGFWGGGVWSRPIERLATSRCSWHCLSDHWQNNRMPSLCRERVCAVCTCGWVNHSEARRGQEESGATHHPGCVVFLDECPPPGKNKKNVGGINSLRQLPCASREKGWTRWHLNCKDEVKIWGAVLFHVLTQGGDGGVWGEAPSLAEARFK